MANMANFLTTSMIAKTTSGPMPSPGIEAILYLWDLFECDAMTEASACERVDCMLDEVMLHFEETL